LAGTQSGHLTGEVGESLRDAWRTEDLSQGLGFFFDEPKDRSRPVGVIFAVQHHLEIAAATGEHTETVALGQFEFVSQTDTGQRCLRDIHTSNMAEMDYFEMAIGAGISGCTDCRGCQPGGPKTKPSLSRHRCAPRTSRAIATYSWVCSFQML
jgi:hypothetical protein